MSKYRYCTVVSKSHISKAIAMRNSLESYCQDYCLSILCVDKEVHQILTDKTWNNVELIKLEEIEDKDLLTAKSNRHEWEYIWTLKPALLDYVLMSYSDAEYFAEIDADSYFFSNPNKIFSEAPEACIYLTDHNNSERFYSFYEISGRYNSGFVGCRNCEDAKAAVKWWREKAIEWCYAQLDIVNKRYGDQRYLDEWPSMFPNVHVIKNVGVNAAHWNIENYKLSVVNDKVYLNKDKLVFYHYSGLIMYNPKEFNLSWAFHLSDAVVKYIYLPCITEISKSLIEIQSNYPNLKHFGFQNPDIEIKYHYFYI